MIAFIIWGVIMHRTIASIAALVAMTITASARQPPPQPQASPAPQRQIRMPPDIQQVTPLGEDKRVQADDIDKLLADGQVVMLDVREPWELDELGTREGYINIPLADLEKRLSELPKDKAILTA